MRSHEVPKTDFGKEFSLIHEAVVIGRKVGADSYFWKAIATDPQLMRKMVAFVRNKGKELFTSHERAGEIMGPDSFFYPEWFCDQRLHYFNFEEKQELEKIPFPEHVLMETKDTHILIACPKINFAGSQKIWQEYFVGIKGAPVHFVATDAPWAFTYESIGWHLIRKDVLPGSITRNVIPARPAGLLGEDLEVPSATLLLYAMVAYYVKNRRWLFSEMFAQTSSTEHHWQIAVTSAKPGKELENMKDIEHGYRTCLRIDRSVSSDQEHGLAVEVRKFC